MKASILESSDILESSGITIEIIVNPSADSQFWKKIFEKFTETEGWSFIQSDYETWLHSIDDFSYYFAVDKSTNEPIACVCSGRHRSLDGNQENDLYGIGMYYVIPEFRGKGLGNYMFNKAIHRIGDHNLVLNGVLKMAPLYAERFGFNKMLPEPHDYFFVPSSDLLVSERDQTVETKDLNEVPFEHVIVYDREILSGFNREKYLKNFLNGPKTMTKIAFQDGKIVGLICLRETGDRLTAGPFYANRLEIAKTLMHDILTDKQDWKHFNGIGSLAPKACTMAQKLFNEMNGGQNSGTPFVQLQFTKRIETATYEKAFGIMEAAMSFV